MGIINVTPDSFSDGGRYLDYEKAVDHAQSLLRQGADIIDIGGESTRPGATTALQDENHLRSVAPNARSAKGSAVTAEEEIRRVIPVIAELKKRSPASVLSVDTYKSDVAREAVEAGAEIVNDVTGFRGDAEMAKTVAELECGAVLMHMRGCPDQWRMLPPPEDVVQLVKRELKESATRAISSGVGHESLVLDPGFGFGKKFAENDPLFARFHELHELGFPLLAGVSRKSLIGRMLAKNGKDAPLDARLYGTLAAEVALILEGAHIIRTHEVKPTVEAARAADTILRAR